MRPLASFLIAVALGGAGLTLALPAAGAQNPPLVQPRLPPLVQEPQIDAKILDRQRRERRAQEQKQLRAEAARLVLLARKLESSVDRSDKNILSLDVVNTADQVEKLAKKIKDSMRSGR